MKLVVCIVLSLMLILGVALLMPRFSGEEDAEEQEDEAELPPVAASVLVLAADLPGTVLADTLAALAERQAERLSVAYLPSEAGGGYSEQGYVQAVLDAAAAHPEATAFVLVQPYFAVAAAAALREQAGEQALLVAALPLHTDDAARAELAAAFDLVVDANTAAIPALVTEQAQALDATALVCFSENAEAAAPFIAAGDALGLNVVQADWPGDYAAAVAEYVALYSEDCAFVTTQGGENETACLAACVAAHAKYPLSLYPDPYIWADVAPVQLPQRPYDGLSEYLSDVREWLMNEQYASRHFTAWRKPLVSAVVNAAAGYALDWGSGLAQQKCDAAVVRQSLLNADGCHIEQWAGPDGAADNLWLMLVNVYTFGSNTNMDCDC